MNFLQQIPAETTNYMILGLAAVFVTMGIHLWSLASRNKRLKQELDLIKEFEQKK